MSDKTDLTVLKFLAQGRTLVWTATATELMPKDVREIAKAHEALRPDGTIDPALCGHAALELAQRCGAPIPAREPAPRPAPPAARAPKPAAPRPVAAAVATDPAGALLQVAIGRVRPDPDNLRENVGDVTELAASLREVGMLQPIVVRRTAGGTLFVVAGHRRLAAARAAGWTTVPVIVRADMLPDEVLAAMLAENGHRLDLDPIEEARGLARLKGQLACSEAALAKRIGRHQTHVSGRLRLLELSIEDQNAVRAGAMKLVEATAKARLNSGKVRDLPPRAYFGAGHDLAPQAKARCRRLHPKTSHVAGGIACPSCWESVIRASERQHLHERSGATGACALCDRALPTRTTTPATTRTRSSA